MAGNLKPDESQPPPVWAFGKKYEFKIYLSSVQHRLHTEHIDGPTTQKTRTQKNRITLHFTGANNPAESSVDTWNTAKNTQGIHTHTGQNATKTGAHYVVERTEASPPEQPYANVVEIADSHFVTHHGGGATAIGIEHANSGAIGIMPNIGFCHDPLTVPPGTPGTTWAQTKWVQHPIDPNLYLRLQANDRAAQVTDIYREIRATYRAGWDGRARNHQALQEKQYLAMILLERHLCIKHRIPRRFLGNTAKEKMKWWTDPSESVLTQSKFHRFRGIFSHLNVTNGHAMCGGPALHHNRLFRGIIDEWWLPVQPDLRDWGDDRRYYSGPFDPQPHQAGQEKPSLFRWVGGTLEAVVFRDANFEALHETKSYFDLDEMNFYYQQAENPDLGGTFPIGTNRVWHGGVHLQPRESNNKVYAAASGTIVVARVSSHPETDRALGSQAFVLIRHVVYWQTERDPDAPPTRPGEPEPQHINYNVDPTYVFSLYMHVEPISTDRLIVEHNDNPPWYNKWLREQQAHQANLERVVGMTEDGDRGRVFNPNIEVSVGDVLGTAGTYYGQRMIHFEIISHRGSEITVVGARSERDDNQNIVSDSRVLNRLLNDSGSPGIDQTDLLRTAPQMRDVRVLHLSEWAWSEDNVLETYAHEGTSTRLLSRETRSRLLSRLPNWPHIRRLAWVKEAMADDVNPDLRTQLGDTFIFWSYHPIEFMGAINRLILEENREVEETSFPDTNAVMENGYLTRYVNFTSTTANDPVRPFDLPPQSEYKFTRVELACLLPGTHSPASNPPQETLFHVNLLDLLQDIQIKYGSSAQKKIIVKLSHVCLGHTPPANSNECVVGTLNSHARGHAVDIHPKQMNKNECKALWDAAQAAVVDYSSDCGAYGGEPSRADLSGGSAGLTISTVPAIQRELVAGTFLGSPTATPFVIHVELLEQQPT